MHHLLFYDPGHFHAALTLRENNPRIAPDIHVYAEPGPQRDAFTRLIESFNRRGQHPTQWRLHFHEGENLLERLIEDKQGDCVVLAGRNRDKLQTIARLTEAGFHVLADKPWLTDKSQLAYLTQATGGHWLAMDLMTIRHEILARLCHQVVRTDALFGGFRDAGPAETSIEVASIHHLYKIVNGQPLRRPAWYYDISVQGDGLVDIQSHLVEQCLWWVLDDSACNYAKDIVLQSARRWTTAVPPELFKESTGLDEYPDSLRPFIENGVLQYACNGEIHYRLRGISVKQTAQWRQREPAGAGDMHHVVIRGENCNVLVQQGPQTAYQAQVHLQPVADFALGTALASAVDDWQKRFPGLSYAPSDSGFRLIAPAGLDRGHESHFPLVLDEFLDCVDKGWPPAAMERIRARYTLLADARELALH